MVSVLEAFGISSFCLSLSQLRPNALNFCMNVSHSRVKLCMHTFFQFLFSTSSTNPQYFSQCKPFSKANLRLSQIDKLISFYRLKIIDLKNSGQKIIRKTVKPTIVPFYATMLIKSMSDNQTNQKK